MPGEFPRTTIEDLDVSRMIIGTNWFLGFSHTSKSKDDYIKQTMTRERIADVLERFFREGVDTLLGIRPEAPHLVEAVKDAEDRTGVGCRCIGTPHIDVSGTPQAAEANARTFDAYAEIGVRVCMPHQCSTDAMLDRKSRSLPGMDAVCKQIRDRGMIPGLSTHTAEAPIYADESGLDVGAYIQIYNAAGFLMHIEIDWVNRMIWERQRPVVTIKPMAAGRIPPFVGMNFVWSTLRPQDMVCVGTMTPDEAAELIELSRSCFERRAPEGELQRTRSKASVEANVPGA